MESGARQPGRDRRAAAAWFQPRSAAGRAAHIRPRASVTIQDPSATPPTAAASALRNVRNLPPWRPPPAGRTSPPPRGPGLAPTEPRGRGETTPGAPRALGAASGRASPVGGALRPGAGPGGREAAARPHLPRAAAGAEEAAEARGGACVGPEPPRKVKLLEVGARGAGRLRALRPDAARRPWL